jgi:hypothetical protein
MPRTIRREDEFSISRRSLLLGSVSATVGGFMTAEAMA